MRTTDIREIVVDCFVGPLVLEDLKTEDGPSVYSVTVFTGSSGWDEALGFMRLLMQ